VLGRTVLVLAPVVALVLLGPYWSQLIVAGILVPLLRPLLDFFGRRLSMCRGWALVLTVLVLIVILTALIMLVPFLRTSVQGLSHELAGAAAEVALDLVDFLDNNREVIIQGVVIDLSPLVDAVIEHVQRDPEPPPLEVLISVFRDLVDTLNNSKNTSSHPRFREGPSTCRRWSSCLASWWVCTSLVCWALCWRCRWLPAFGKYWYTYTPR
jgi:predicted PurR-regulated permease PerM